MTKFHRTMIRTALLATSLILPQALLAQTEIAPVPEIAALLPESIREAGVLRIAIPDVGRPLSYQENGTYEGLDPDFARAISAVLGLEPQMEMIPFPAALTGLQADRFDLSYGEFYVTAERLQVADFVTSWQDYSSFLVRADTDFAPTAIDEICGKTVGAMAGSAELALLQSATAGCAEAATVNAYPSVSNAVLAINSGRVDGVLINRGGAQESINLDAGLAASGEFGGGPTATAVARTDNSPELLAALKAAYDHLIESGAYMAILEENDVVYGAVEEAEIYTQESTPPNYSF
ncbi:transporter substrate-binding domain-containing protein [Pararhodobacter sp. CCB-MM2]|uniref:transporter substrate-binding domain-containing protein n=1 Tax=Pararhodobacter sp. CCB-MM2 TaxID=1786003 RepID=UPI0008307D32|nr:transporter substrate-binding domain-containing protein [Pararhodobacter sp. CCB-MM2]